MAIVVRRIREPKCKLYDTHGNLVGVIRSFLMLNDVRIQIMEEQASGYYIRFKDHCILIDERGSLSCWPKGFYERYENQLLTLIGSERRK